MTATRPRWLAALLLVLVVPASADASGTDVFRATVEIPHKDAGPQEPVAFPIRLERLGEEPVRVRFELVQPAAPGWQVIPPQPIVLPGAAAGAGSAKFAILMVQTPYANGHVDERATVELRAIASPEDDASVTLQEVPLTATVHARGFYLPAPDLSTVLATLALAGLALRGRAREA